MLYKLNIIFSGEKNLVIVDNKIFFFNYANVPSYSRFIHCLPGIKTVPVTKWEWAHTIKDGIDLFTRSLYFESEENALHALIKIPDLRFPENISSEFFIDLPGAISYIKLHKIVIHPRVITRVDEKEWLEVIQVCPQ